MQSKCKFKTSELYFHVGLCYFRRPAHQICTASPLRLFKWGKNIGRVLLKCSLFPLLSVLLPPQFSYFCFIFVCMHSGTLHSHLLWRARLQSPTTNNTRRDICRCGFGSGRLSACALDSVKVNGTQEPLQRNAAVRTGDRAARRADQKQTQPRAK